MTKYERAYIIAAQIRARSPLARAAGVFLERCACSRKQGIRQVARFCVGLRFRRLGVLLWLSLYANPALLCQHSGCRSQGMAVLAAR